MSKKTGQIRHRSTRKAGVGVEKIPVHIMYTRNTPYYHHSIENDYLKVFPGGICKKLDVSTVLRDRRGYL